MNLTKEKEATGETTSVIVLSPSPEGNLKTRAIRLFGSLTEDKAEEIVQSLFDFEKLGIEAAQEESTNSKNTSEIIHKPIDFYISTWGGCAYSMFALYDVVRSIREHCDIQTWGLGKVMSAGVLLLAAGTKGKRKIGKHCRIMIHSAAGDQWGPLHSLENEMNEIRWIQEQHITALIKETNLTKRQLKKMLDRRVNVYLNAKEAVEYGIADIIV